MIGRGDGDGINIFVLKELTNIDVGFGLWQSQLLDVREAMVRHVFIHIAESGNLCPWNTRKAVDVVGEVRYRDGTAEPLDRQALIAAPEAGLRLLWLAMLALSIGALVARWSV